MNNVTASPKLRCMWLCMALAVLAACGNGSTATDADEEDEGSASMEVAGQTWDAEEAEAELRNSRLKIDASRTDFADGKVERQQLVLIIEDYQGPGAYEAGGGSMFVGVGIDTDRAKEAESDQEVADAAASILSGAETLSLDRAEVTISAANDRFIDGSFDYQPSSRSNRPPVQGRFHALIEE